MPPSSRVDDPVGPCRGSRVEMFTVRSGCRWVGRIAGSGGTSADKADVAEENRRGIRMRLRALEAATGLFATVGYDRTTMHDIATVAGLSVGDVCTYFPTREHFAIAVFDRLADELFAAAVELPTGTVAERFTALMNTRIHQCSNNRRALTALLGQSLDPQSSLYALGPSTDRTRARVRSALAAALASASDAPQSADEIGRQCRVLYSVHLAVVVATLVRLDGTAATYIVERVAQLLSIGRLDLIETVLGAGLDLFLVDDAASGSAYDGGIVREILMRLLRNNRVLPGVPQGLTVAAESVHRPSVEAFVQNGLPIHLVLPAFPAKAPNHRKVLGTLPDLAERRALERLSELLDEIGEIWAPGGRLTICSDGHVFADAVGVADSDVDAYRAALLEEISDPRIDWFDLHTAFDSDEPAELRSRLITHYAEDPDSLRSRSHASPSLALQVDGIHRFLYEDELARHPGLSKNQARKLTRDLAYDVVRRSEAWGALVSQVYPSAIRLSIHPQPDPSAKIGINLLGVSDPWLTPWHGCAVVGPTGTRLMHRCDAEAAGAVVAFRGDRPSHLEVA